MLSLASEFRTPLHEVSVWVKFPALIAATILLLWVSDLWVQALIAVILAVVFWGFGAAFGRAGLRALRPIWFFVLVVMIWNGWRGDWGEGALVSLRLVNAFALANLFTMTTRLDDMLILFEGLLRPFERLGLPVRAAALALALAMRFIPVLRARAGVLRESWRARSVRRVNWRIVTPLALLALDDAEQIADALRARGGVVTKRRENDERA